jgi:dUTP pyrophosphatase
VIKNAKTVEEILCNIQHGKKAQNGFDLSLKEIKCFKGTGVIHKDKTEVPSYEIMYPDEKGYYNLYQGVYSLTFNEGGKIPQNHCGWIKTRSSLIRNGSIIEAGLYDTGFECENFGAFLFVNNFISIEQDARVAQFILFEAEEAEEYNGQWQKEKDKK